VCVFDALAHAVPDERNLHRGSLPNGHAWPAEITPNRGRKELPVSSVLGYDESRTAWRGLTRRWQVPPARMGAQVPVEIVVFTGEG
jgi:hypothetical protein